MKLELHPNANDTLTPHAILAVNGPMIARSVTIAEGEWIVTACNEYDGLKELLAASMDAMRTADESLALAQTVQGLLVDALIEAVKHGGPFVAQARAALTAAGVTP